VRVRAFDTGAHGGGDLGGRVGGVKKGEKWVEGGARRRGNRGDKGRRGAEGKEKGEGAYPGDWIVRGPRRREQGRGGGEGRGESGKRKERWEWGWGRYGGKPDRSLLQY